jgi:DNA (cytosine-5)-methyltransferase 1
VSRRPAPTFVSTFAGCGGSSLGWKTSGFRELLAVEWDKTAVAAFRLNFPGVPVWDGDIRELTVEEALRLAGVAPGELDVLDGSPPCQGFSTAGKRREGDTRNTLTLEYVRLLNGLRPRAFVMENVTGLVKGKMARFYLEFMAQLRSAGPGYRAKGMVLNSAHFGVPQSRPRVIVIGFREDLGIEPTFPAPTASRMLTAEEAIADVQVEQDQREWMLEYCARPECASFRDWQIVRPGQSLSKEGNRENYGFGCTKAHPRRPIPTIRRNDGTLGMHGSMHWAERRRFTVAEYRRFFGYPDSFQFPAVEGTKKVPAVGRTWSAAVALMGNSVPPPLMSAVSKHVLMCLNSRTEPKGRADGHPHKSRKERADGAHPRKRPKAGDRPRRRAAQVGAEGRAKRRRAPRDA